MEDVIVIYASPEHLNSMLILAKFITKHHTSLPVIIISAASTAAAVSVAAVPSITYHPLPAPAIPPNFTTNPVERFFEIPRLQNPVLLQALQQISEKSKIRAFVMDFFCNSAFEVSRSLNLPTYYYVSSGGFGLCALLYFPTIDKTICQDIGNSNQFLDIPGCPSFHALDFPQGMHFRASNTYKHFLGFGRRGLFSAEQLMEMARGLENSGHRFIWAVRSPPGSNMLPAPEDFDLNSVLPEGFLERTQDKGFVLKSWAPQRDILGHASVAGFVTHCGRSSILEAVSLGVPMIGWPMYAEQKMNRTFMVEEMKVALSLDMKANGFVTAAELERRLRELVESETGKSIRLRVAELKAAAAATVAKGGSSVVDLDKFIGQCFIEQ